MEKIIVTLGVIATVAAFGCGGGEKAARVESKAVQTESNETVYARIDTSMGTMLIELYQKDAPKTAQNFIDLAEGKKKWKDPKTGRSQENKPIYDGAIFHRLIPGFMIQGGDPSGTGAGDVGFTIPLEKSPNLKHDRTGRVAMARRPDPDSASCQFYITFQATPLLDDPRSPYAVFGQVIEGIDVLKDMEKVPTGAQDRPTQTISIKKVTIVRVPAGQTKSLDLGGAAPASGQEPTTETKSQ